MIFNIISILPEIFLSVHILTVIFVTLYADQLSKSLDQYLMILVGTCLLILNINSNSMYLFNDSYFISSSNSLVKLILITFVVFIILISREYLKLESLKSFEFGVLVLISLLGIVVLVSSADLLVLYLALELQSLSFYVLASYKRSSELSTEAGIKYFVLGALGSGFFLFGASLIYMSFGTMNLYEIQMLLETGFSTTPILAVLFILIALLYKLGIAPFHSYVPDVYEGSPLIVLGYFAMVPKLAVFFIIVNLFYHTFNFVDYQLWIVICSMLSIGIGSLGALMQHKITRFLAYSSIGHMGYLLIGFSSNSPIGLNSSYLYMLIYMVLSLGFFSLVMYYYLPRYNKITVSSSDNVVNSNDALDKQYYSNNISYFFSRKYIKSYIGAYLEQPFLAVLLMLFIISMSGIPPLSGFFVKYYVFLAGLQSGLYLLVLVGIMFSLLNAFLYLRFITYIYKETNNQYKVDVEYNDSVTVNNGYFSIYLIIILATMVNVLYILFPGGIYLISHVLSLGL